MGYGGGPRCCPIALPALALCPRRELGTKIRAPRAPCVMGGAVNSPAQGLSGPHTWGRLLLLSPAPRPLLGGVCVCVRPCVRPSPALGQQLLRCRLPVPWDALSCLGQGQSRGPMSAAPGCRKNLGGGSRACWGQGTHVAFERCFMCCMGDANYAPHGAGVAVSHGTWVLHPVPISPRYPPRPCSRPPPRPRRPSGRLWGGGEAGP